MKILMDAMDDAMGKYQQPAGLLGKNDLQGYRKSVILDNQPTF